MGLLRLAGGFKLSLCLALVDHVEELAVLVSQRYGAIACRLGVDRFDEDLTKEFIEVLEDLDSAALISCLRHLVHVGLLRHRDDRNQQVQHQNDQEQAREEEDDPVVVVEVRRLLPGLVEVSETESEGDLPEVAPALPARPEAQVQVLLVELRSVGIFASSYETILLLLLYEHALMDGVEGIGEGCDAGDEDKKELRDL